MERPEKALTSASYKNSYDSILTESSNLEEPIFSRRGRKGKLSHEQQFLLTLMRIRLALLVEDLAFRFRIAESTVNLGDSFDNYLEDIILEQLSEKFM